MKGLEALNILARNVESLEIDTFYECKGAYQFLEKSLKALEIIKKKDVNIWYLTVSTKVKNYKDYNSFLMNDKGKRQLTEEEFNLLKEVLE